MCQLLGMNCASPTDFSFSFKGFCQRGGATDIHAHGFGLAIYEGRGLRCFLDTLPAFESPIAKLVQHYPIRTYNMIAHVRYATTGAVSLENVHPFSRELWGIQWTFAHNGQVPKFDDSTPLHDQPLLGKTKNRKASSSSSNNNNDYNNDDDNDNNNNNHDLHYYPIGDTDSEAVFCAILNALKAEFTELPTLPVLHSFLSQLCNEIVHGEEDTTIFNFLLGCGQYTLFAYSWPGRRPGSTVWNGLYYIIRQPPFSTAKLIDVDYSIDFAKFTTPNDRVAVITTSPLTDEDSWVEFQRGELLMFDKGLPYKTSSGCAIVEEQGRGLYSKCFNQRQEQQRRQRSQSLVVPFSSCSGTSLSSSSPVCCTSLSSPSSTLINDHTTTTTTTGRPRSASMILPTTTTTTTATTPSTTTTTMTATIASTMIPKLPPSPKSTLHVPNGVKV